jgi:hypothetical protein
MAKANKINGYVIYQGPSLIDGQPIVAIATGLANKSSNDKTGAMVQTWILRADISPTEALNTGDDTSICGACPHRGTIENGRNVNRACYVTVWQAPLVVWKAHTQRGIYPTAEVDQLGALFAGRTIRLGSYGDPAAVPQHVWEALVSQANGHTGYTHQWNVKGADGKRKFVGLRSLVMASADSHQEMVLANSLGFRTFRVTGQDSRADKVANEVICPASKEMDYKTNCQACKACGGTTAKAKANIVITVHGSAGKVNAHKTLAQSA